MRCVPLTLLLALVFAGALRDAAWAHEYGAGFRDLRLTDPVEGGPMPAIVFYPTSGDGGSTQIGPYSVAATRGAAPANGAFALIVHSHGKDPPGIDRAAIHARLNAEMILFFRRTLIPR